MHLQTLTLSAFLYTLSSACFSANWNVSPADNIIKLDFGVAVEEIYLLDAFDVNDDGYDDFVVSALVDVESQIGVSCCRVPPSLVGQIKKLTPQLLLSDSNGRYRQIPFPKESETIRTWTGKFFTLGRESYFFLGRNGEVSDPVDGNSGETSVLFKFVADAGNQLKLEPIAETLFPATTANVQIVPGQIDVYMLENNYLDFENDHPWSRSYVYQFNGKNLQIAPFAPTGFDMNKANNHLQVADLDGDGKYDILVAAEVMFDFNTNKPQSEMNGSYVIFDALGDTSSALLPQASFGTSHAGSHISVVSLNSSQYVIEIGVRLENRNQFREPALSVYEFTPPRSFDRLDIKHDQEFDVEKFQMSDTQLIDIDADGDPEVFFQNYSSKPLYLDFDPSPVLKALPSNQVIKPLSGKGRAIALKTPTCVKLASIEDWKKSRYPLLKISANCL